MRWWDFYALTVGNVAFLASGVAELGHYAINSTARSAVQSSLGLIVAISAFLCMMLLALTYPILHAVSCSAIILFGFAGEALMVTSHHRLAAVRMGFLFGVIYLPFI